MTSDCKRCNTQLQPGIAIEQTWAGYPDFVGGEVVTLSPGGPGRVVTCWKCPKCGHSVTKLMRCADDDCGAKQQSAG
jgi:hypothetical protein